MQELLQPKQLFWKSGICVAEIPLQEKHCPDVNRMSDRSKPNCQDFAFFSALSPVFGIILL